MYSQAFFDPLVVSDLLDACRAEGWLQPPVIEKAHSLIHHGLHPEQALIGTGLIDAEQYGEALSQVFDLPFVRIFQESRHAKILDEKVLNVAHAHIIDRDATSVFVAFADPSNESALRAIRHALQAHGLLLTPAVALWSDMRSRNAMPAPRSTVATLRRKLENACDQANTRSLEMGHAHSGWHVLHQGALPLKQDWQVSHPAVSLSAFALHLERMKKKMSEWTHQVIPTSLGSVVHISRSSPQKDDHPLAWSEIRRLLTEQVVGVQVFIHLDLQTERQLIPAANDASEPGAHWHASAHIPYAYRVHSHRAREEALHAALSGRPTIVIQSEKDISWLKPVAALGVPVACFERVPVPEGAAWMAHVL